MKKLFSFVCALVCAMSLSAQAQTKTIYLSLGSIDWGKDGASFKEAVSGKSMTAVDGKSGYYQVAIEETQTTVTFQRIGNGTDVWNKHENLAIPDGKDLYTLTGWDNSGTWSVFADAPATQKYFALHGNFTGEWKTTEFTFSEDGATATRTMQLTAKSYEFGARIGNSDNWTANGTTITRDNNTTDFSKIESTDNNKMTADVAGKYVFTYTVATKVLTVTYPEEEKKYTLTFGVIGENGTLTAMSGETAIESGAQVASATLTATPAEGYKVEGWYSNQGGTTALEGASGNTHTVVLSADMSVYVKFTIDNTPKETVFFVNTNKWKTVNCYAWTDGGGKNATWPGDAMTKADYQLKDADVYFYVARQGDYAKCIFNNGDKQQTGNLTWTAGKYYYDNAWRTRAELESDEPLSTVIQLHGDFKGSSWSTLDPFTYNEAKTEATFVVTKLEAEKTYNFGLKFDGNYKANGATITASVNSTNLGEGSGDMKLTTTIAGDYTFTYVLATEVLTVTYPSSNPTALSNTEVENAVVKVIRNGQVLIVREGVTYNMMGQVIQ